MKNRILLAIPALLLVASQASALSVDTKDTPVSQSFVNVSRKLIPSVVNIFTTSTMKTPRWGGQGGGQDDLWRRFFEEFFGEGMEGGQKGPRRNLPQGPRAMSLGSGFVIEKSNSGGLILTNNHVIDGADEIKVKFTEEVDEKESVAEVLGRDPDLDIAILKVKTKRTLIPVTLGDSEKLEAGEWIAAVGNPFGHGHSVTHGIVSAKERTLPGSFANFLQVDAPINPGNSGGPLVNLAGEVVGINNAIDARGPGIGFAIPIHLVKKVLPQLKDKGMVERGYIGVSIDELRPSLAKSLKLDENLRAPIITNVVEGQPAAKAGLEAQDVIIEVNGKTVRSGNELVAAITDIPVGQRAKIKVLRQKKERTFEVPVGRRPDFRADRPVQPKDKKGAKPKVETGMILDSVDPEIAAELDLPANYKGIVVSQVESGGPAFHAGLGRGDVILEVDRKPVKTPDEFYSLVKEKKTYLLRVRKTDDQGVEAFAIVALQLGEKIQDPEEE